jgi:DNA-binding NarL/FixJ family response regulator
MMLEVHTVLVTDERPAAAFLYVLTDERFNVVGHAYSGVDVLPLVGRLDPDVVVLDLDMTGLDGLGCVREIVSLNPAVKVVVVVASADREVMRAAFERGACGCVLQPCDGARLPAAIWRVLNGGTYEEDSPS